MALSHYAFDRLTPIDSSESGVGAGGAKVNPIRVQPHRRSKDNKPVLDYDSNDDFDETEFNDSDTPNGQDAFQQLDNFHDYARSPEERLSDDFTIVTQENSLRFLEATQENSTRLPQATRENAVHFSIATQDDTRKFNQATQDTSGVTQFNSGRLSRVNGRRHGM
jgi:hypothetical protein